MYELGILRSDSSHTMVTIYKEHIARFSGSDPITTGLDH